MTDLRSCIKCGKSKRAGLIAEVWKGKQGRGVCRACLTRYGAEWRARLAEEIPWANRQAKHVLRKVPTCGLELEDVQTTAWHATYRAIQKFDAAVGAPFQQFALRYVQRMVWTQVRSALQKRMKEGEYIKTVKPADMVHHDKLGEICAVDSPLALACQYLMDDERRIISAWLAGREFDQEQLRKILDEIKADLLDRGVQCAGDVLLGSIRG